MEPTKDKQQVTTLGVEKKLAKKAKIQAAVKGTTLKEFTEQAIREKLEREKKQD